MCIRVGKKRVFYKKKQPTWVFWKNPWVKKNGFNVFFFNLSGYLKEMSQKANLLNWIKKSKTCTFTMTIATQGLLNFLNQMCLNK